MDEHERVPTKGPRALERRLGNRARLREEVSEGLRDLMRKRRIGKAALARRAGCSEETVERVLEGSYSFTIETLADLSIALGRGVHVVFGADAEEMRLPHDEAD